MPDPNYTLLRYQADNVPKFDGNPKLLQRFVTACENLLKAFQNTANVNDPINTCLFDTILSKLTGRAAELIVSRTELNNWALVKHALISTFADQRSIDCLIQDLINLKPNKNEHPINFGMRIQDSRSLLSAKLNATNEAAGTRLIKIQHYDEFALKTFIRGLPYNMQLIIRLKNPRTLEEAMSHVREEENFIYFKNAQTPPTKPLPLQNVKSQRPPPTYKPPYYQNYTPSYNQNYNQNYNQPPNNPFTSYRPQFPNFNNNNNNNFPRQFSNMPQRPNFNMAQPRFLQNTRFNPNFSQNSNRTKIEPMDTSSGNTILHNTPSKQIAHASQRLYNQEVIKQDDYSANQETENFENTVYDNPHENNNIDYFNSNEQSYYDMNEQPYFTPDEQINFDPNEQNYQNENFIPPALNSNTK